MVERNDIVMVLILGILIITFFGGLLHMSNEGNFKDLKVKCYKELPPDNCVKLFGDK